MTGKQLKAFASKVSDEAIIEINKYNWTVLETKEIRAVYTPELTMDDVNNLEDVKL